MKISCLIVILTIAITQSGCVAVVAGAAAGGYYVGQDERTAGQIADDLALTAQVKALLIKDKSIRGLSIDVDTRLLRVTLTGQVSSAAEAERAIRIAESVKGVVDVQSNLTVTRVEVQEKST